MAKINLDYYNGVDEYSDGDIEDEIMRLVKENDDFTHILKERNNWPVMYHLSPVRRNLLEWYDFNKQGTLLEIGGGCGAFSGMFAERLKSVKVIELSKRRSEIIYHRHKNHENLEIIVGNFNDLNLSEKFDYITLIGVLEYAGKFMESDNPYVDFLLKVKAMLKDNGKLIIAIENKFGLKYWGGACEDHTGRLFDSIENYPNYTGVRTFGKNELVELLKEAGFFKNEFYYPMPDYKLPNTIYSDAYLPDETVFFAKVSPNFDQARYVLFDESVSYRNIIKNKMFDFFANSFLVVVE